MSKFDVQISKTINEAWEFTMVYINGITSFHVYTIKDTRCVSLDKYIFDIDNVTPLRILPEELETFDSLVLKHMTGETTLTINELDILYNMYLYLTDKITEQELRGKVTKVLEEL